ncbi:hypothetical protein [Streptomyces sp. NPDC007205]|uniref:hypothetical protein n=1 Tax=Streptomyces sp. NPDC007205 TaxID=3154316 RepID=UPI0033F0FD0A
MDYSLVIAAAQAAGPCSHGEELAWGRRVHALTVDLHLIAQQAAQDIARLENASRFVAFLENVEIEESSRRGLLTLRNPAGDVEQIPVVSSTSRARVTATEINRASAGGTPRTPASSVFGRSASRPPQQHSPCEGSIGTITGDQCTARPIRGQRLLLTFG